MQGIKIPTYPLKLKSSGNQKYVYDIIRKKYVVFTPEEFVRQNMLWFLVNDRGYAPGLISVEQELKFNCMRKRYDIVVFNTKKKPLLLIECKAPSVQLSRQTVDQIGVYNQVLDSTLLIITNGNITYCYTLLSESGDISLLNDIPFYETLMR